MDQFSAHLDRGWELVQRGDARGAEASAKRALELDPQSPEAYNLLGYVAALQGEAEEAVESYRQAIALDDTYLEAMLNAAEVYIHPLAEFEQAISMCDQALDLAETDEEIVDALLLKFDALSSQGDDDAAAEVLSKLPAPPYPTPNQAFLVGRAWYEQGDVDRAAPLIEEVIQEDPAHPDAHYYLGLVRDELGDMAGATAAFVRARELDLELAPPAWSAGREAFTQAVDAVLQLLDPILRRYVHGAAVYVTDLPGIELVADGVDPRSLVLLDGIRPGDPPAGGCDRVFVYQRNVERLAGGPDGVDAELTTALEREISGTFVDAAARDRARRELN